METAVTVFDPFRAQLTELKEYNSSIHFDYEDLKGNKEARSHVYKLRQTKTALERARKAEKQDSLDYGRKVDSEAKVIELALDEMISVHQAPLDEIEARETKRVADLEARVVSLTPLLSVNITYSEATELLKTVEGIAVDDTFMEYRDAAEKAKAESVRNLLALVAKLEKQEKEAAELAELRKQSEERTQKERDEKIAKDAADRATKDAEEKSLRDKQLAEERELKLIKEREEADARAAQAATDERLRIEKENADKAAADAAREADRKHQVAIHGAIIKAVGPLGITEEQAKALIKAIRGGSVPHMKIIY